MKSASQLQIFNCIGEAKISYKTTGMPFGKITCSYDTVEFLRRIWDMDTLEYSESFCALALNRNNQVIAYKFVGHGGVSAVIADPKIIFQFALLSNASALIVSHNHPSGNLKPSQPDINLTGKVKTVGIALDMPLLDHIIITKDSYTSFADQGMI